MGSGIFSGVQEEIVFRGWRSERRCDGYCCCKTWRGIPSAVGAMRAFISLRPREGSIDGQVTLWTKREHASSCDPT